MFQLLLQQLDFQCFAKGYLLACKTWPFTARKVAFYTVICRVLEKRGCSYDFLSVNQYSVIFRFFIVGNKKMSFLMQ